MCAVNANALNPQSWVLNPKSFLLNSKIQNLDLYPLNFYCQFPSLKGNPNVEILWTGIEIEIDMLKMIRVKGKT